MADLKANARGFLESPRTDREASGGAVWAEE